MTSALFTAVISQSYLLIVINDMAAMLLSNAVGFKLKCQFQSIHCGTKSAFFSA